MFIGCDSGPQVRLCPPFFLLRGYPREYISPGVGRPPPAATPPDPPAVLTSLHRAESQRRKKHAVLFPVNGPQNEQLEKYFFLPPFSLTARRQHNIL